MPPRSQLSTRPPYERALDLLARRARSVKELRDALARKAADPTLVEPAIERLLAAGLLDDAAFARQYARSRALNAGSSRRRIQQELARKGVSRALAEEALAEVFEEEAVDEEGIVEQAARKKMRSLAKLDPQVRTRRLWSFLARRGYDTDSIRRAIATVTGEDPEVEAEVEGE
ncbi:MAG: regulatory protein RecX [Gemmatimonadaceae bacterium]